MKRPVLNLFGDIYRRVIPQEYRYQLYKMRHPARFRAVRTEVNPSPKGDFSLQKFSTYRCIFVHITKSAGTSVALSLFNQLPYHYRAWEYRVIFGKKDFNRYFKFAFVRNPWDRLYSAFSYLKGGGWDDDDRAWAEQHLAGVDNFEDFVLDWLTPARRYSHMHFWPQSDFICDRYGRPMIDHIGYFETLDDDFRFVAEHLGIRAALEHRNPSVRRRYQEAYSRETIDKVRLLYGDDIRNFGYSFDGFTRKRIANGTFSDA